MNRAGFTAFPFNQTESIMPSAALNIPASSPKQSWQSIGVFVAALFLFACVAATNKYLAASYSVLLLTWLRFSIQWLGMSAILVPKEGWQLLAAQRKGLVIVRGACMLIMMLLVTTALQRMPVAEVTAIQFLAPLLVTLLAKHLLKETIGSVRGWCVIAGFLGVLLIAHPGGQLDPVGVVCVLLAACMDALYQLLSRLLGSTERSIVMLYYSALVSVIVLSLGLPGFWTDFQLSPLDAVLFLWLGLAGGVGHYLFTVAYRHTPASTLAPLNYLQLFWAGLLGWLIFGQLPSALSLLGMAIIVVSGIVAAVHGRR